VDNARLDRRLLAAFLSRRRRFSVVGEAENGKRALAQARALRPDVVLVEPEVFEGGPELVGALCAATPRSLLLVLTRAKHEESPRPLLQAGARGYLRKDDCEPEDVVRAIERVIAGEVVLGPGAGKSIFSDVDADQPRSSDLGGLSGREREVLSLIAAGATNREIARELYITENTVKGHVATILNKLGLDNRVQLATFALRHDLGPELPPEVVRVDPSIRTAREAQTSARQKPFQRSLAGPRLRATVI
jgi:DNA-binding NarL/FixJ family response regulator